MIVIERVPSGDLRTKAPLLEQVEKATSIALAQLFADGLDSAL